MGRLNAEERLSRMQRDTGEMDETVFYSGSQYMKMYHDERDCGELKRQDTVIRSDSRERMQTRMYGPCKVCVLDECEQEYVGGAISKLERAIREGRADHLMEDAR